MICRLHFHSFVVFLTITTLKITPVDDKVAFYSETLEEPVIEKQGDFIIVGIFNIGELKEDYNQ